MNSLESGPVKQLRDAGGFSWALPASHRAKWKHRTLQLGRDPYKLDTLLPYVLKLKRGTSDIALRDAAHALVTGLGLLFVLKNEGSIADIIDLAGINGPVLVAGSWLTITTGQRGKYSFMCSSLHDAQSWQGQLNVRINEAKGTTLRTRQVYDDALSRLKNELEKANQRRKTKKADKKKQPLPKPIELEILSNNPTPAETVPSKSVCSICYEYYEPQGNLKDTHFATHNICTDCIKQYIQFKVGSGTTKINCVEPECTVEITYLEIKRQIDSDQLFSAYDERLFRETAKQDPNFRWCANPKCTAANLIDPPSSPATPSTSTDTTVTPAVDPTYFICPSCDAKTCFSCGEYAHPKRTCEEYKKYITEQGIIADAPTVEYLNEVSVTCYKCSSLLQRTEGCVLIRCLNCGSDCCAGCGGQGHGHECRRLPQD